MIDYISDVLCNLKLVFMMGCIIIGFTLYVQPPIEYFNIKANFKKLFIVFIVCLIAAILLPSGLKYNYVSNYIDKNNALELKIIQMERIIQEHHLEKQLKELQDENY